MPIFRTSAPQDPLIVSVSGVRLGQRVLALPGADLRTLVDVAARVGLTGRVLALTRDESDSARVQAHAERHGVLVDVERLQTPVPVPDEAFDVAIVDTRGADADRGKTLPALLPSMLRALRPGGRLVLLLQGGGGIAARLLGRDVPPRELDERLRALIDTGFRTARLVALRDGIAFVEAMRSGT